MAAKKKKKSEKKSVPINFKLTIEEREIIGKLAERFAGGNVSGWMRRAAIEHRPKKAA